MPKSRTSRSLFSSLPIDLKKSLRSQTVEPYTLAPRLDSVQVKAEFIADTVQFGPLLHTQPQSPGVSPDAAEIVDLTEEPAESSTSAALRTKRPENVLTSPRSAKERRGKEKVPANPHQGHAWDCTGLVPRFSDYSQLPQQLAKYFAQRHLLFPLYDDLPLLLDETGWYSITPQPIAAHIAERCRCDVVLDAFCGVGGNAIEFARTCERVIAIDNDLTRLRLARHNALHHGVADRIEFILADFTDFARTYSARHTREKIDVVFLSPPWGGPDYLDPHVYLLSAILPIPGPDLFEISSTLTPNIAFHLPRNVDIDEVSLLARRLDPPEQGREREWVEIEEEWVGDKLKAVTAYFGGLVASE